MRFAFTDDQLMLASVVRDVLAKDFTPAELWAVWDAGTGHAPDLWRSLAEIGVIGMLLPESAGGMQLSMTDAVLVFEELGYAAAPGPFVETIAVAGPVAANEPSTVDLARDLAAGVVVSAAAIDGSPYVAHAAVSGSVLTPTGFVTGFDAVPVQSLDGGRQLAVVSGGDARWFEYDVHAAFDRGATASAAVLLGVGRRMIDIATDYAREREQFGKPIGSFQAVKHLLSDSLLQLEFARPAVYAAAWHLAVGDPAAGRVVAMAKCLASDAAYTASRSTMQVLGGIGYTWEADLHLWMKKAWAMQRSFGDARHHRRRVSGEILGPTGAVTQL